MLSVIIVNYRSWNYLSHCINSLILIKNIEIIVVDNFSNDGLLEKFKLDFPQVKWIESDSNLGFGKACNLGASQANGSYLLFLNPDTIANKEAINQMQAFLIKNTEYKIASCKQHNQIRKHFLLFPNAFTIFGLLRAIAIKWNKAKFEIKEKNGFKFIEPDWASGSVILVSKEWFYEIGGWSEEFWMYSEDVDICKKSRIRNGKTALLTDVEIFHKHGGASRINIKTTAMAKAEVIKSKHVYFQKYFTGFANIFSQSVFIFLFLFIKLPMALLGLIFFFIPKLLLQTEIFKNLTKYYRKVILTRNWQSEKVRLN